MSIIKRRALFVGLAGLGVSGFGLAGTVIRANAATAVKVTLWDKGANSMMMLGREHMRGMGMQGAMMHNSTMGITATPASAKAGEITFEAINSSKDIVHEMIVAPMPNPVKSLPYDVNAQRVDEEKAGHLGEVAELAPGAAGALRITLKPGKYLLYCNVTGHYALGMWTEFTVVT